MAKKSSLFVLERLEKVSAYPLPAPSIAPKRADYGGHYPNENVRAGWDSFSSFSIA